MIAQAITDLSARTDLSPSDLGVLGAIAFGAGIVRGFSGFALSALVMATATTILPPITLIPILWFMEMTASMLMLRGGIVDADRRVVAGLVVGTLIGTPIGLSITTTVDPAVSALIALSLIVVLALSQLARVRIAFLSTRAGLLISGICAGIASGLAAIGGMVVALYVLARTSPARQMRASLVIYLFVSAAGSMIYLGLYGLIDRDAVMRGLILSVPVALGVLVGQLIFTPSMERYYRTFCLVLLIVLASTGLVRRIVQ